MGHPLAGEAEAVVDELGRHGAAGRGRALVQQADAVPQRPVGQPGQDPARLRLEVDALLVGDVAQPGGDVLRQQPPEGEALAAGEDRGRDLVQLRGGQDKDQMLRRLLDDLEQGVEGRRREHMDLVDDVDPLLDLRRGIDGVVPQCADVVDAVVGGGVDLKDVHAGALLDAAAGGAVVAGVAVDGVLAVDGPRQNLGAGGLTGTPGAGEQIGMAQPPRGHLGLEGLGDALLAHDLVKGPGPVFPIQRLIHGASPLPAILANLRIFGKAKPGP